MLGFWTVPDSIDDTKDQKSIETPSTKIFDVWETLNYPFFIIKDMAFSSNSG